MCALLYMLLYAGYARKLVHTWTLGRTHLADPTSDNPVRSCSSFICTRHALNSLIPPLLVVPSRQRLSTRRTCIAPYANKMKAAEKTASPTTSFHRARTSNPKELRMAEPGTSMSRPYLWSTRLRYRTSLTIKPSKPKWKIDSYAKC
jgi:hypothetical protein